MKVYTNNLEQIKNNKLERELAYYLHDSHIDGFALLGYTITDPKTKRQCEIDALVLLDTGVIICIEAKKYSGTWTGNLNGEWKSDGRTILCPNDLTNPGQQLMKCYFSIKNRLKSLFSDDTPFVSMIVVAPDHAQLKLDPEEIGINATTHTTNVCNLKYLGNLLQNQRKRKLSNIVRREFQKIGREKIIEKLIGVTVENLIPLPLRELVSIPEIKIVEKGRVEEDINSTPISLTTTDGGIIEELGISSGHNGKEQEPDIPTVEESKAKGEDNGDGENGTEGKGQPPGGQKDTKKWMWVVLACLGLLACIGLLDYLRGGQKMNTYVGQENLSLPERKSYKDLTSSHLVIGIIGDSSDYEPLQKYLEEQLGSKVMIKKADGQASELGREIIEKEWDIVFAYSPMNSILAQDNGYQWIGRMYADEDFFYSSFLVTNKLSLIDSIDDIKPNTKVALGKVVSSSGFYQPIYDLYGKNFYLIPNVSSRKVGDYLKEGKADVAAVSELTLKSNPDLKVIHQSKQLPGSGIFLSDRLSPRDRDKLKELLFNAPANVKEGKEVVNYKPYPEFDYKEFRVIKRKVDNILSCRPIEEGSFQNYGCNSEDGDKSGITGKFNGWTRKGDEIIFKLKAGKDNYSVILKESLLSNVPGCTTPTLCNNKDVEIVDVPVEDDDGKLTLRLQSGDNLQVKD